MKRTIDLEKQVLALRNEGLSYSEISQSLSISKDSAHKWANPARRDAHNANSRKRYYRDPQHGMNVSNHNRDKNRIRYRIYSRNGIAARKGHAACRITQDKEFAILILFPMCMLCDKKRAAVTDHCHVTGVVRGRLCRGCNTKLGAIDTYLQNPEFRAKVDSYRQNNFS